MLNVHVDTCVYIYTPLWTRGKWQKHTPERHVAKPIQPGIVPLPPGTWFPFQISYTGWNKALLEAGKSAPTWAPWFQLPLMLEVETQGEIIVAVSLP